MSLKRFVLSKRVGPQCENLKTDVQTAQYLFNAAGLDRELGIEYFPVTGAYGPGLERAISVFQSVKVPEETRVNRYILAPGSATWGKLVEAAKKTGDAAEYWNSLTPSQRERYAANLQRLKIEKQNWVPFTHQAGLALQALLNDHPKALGFLQRILGTNETGITLVQLALDSLQLMAFINMVTRLGMGFSGIVQALKVLVGIGGEGANYLQKVANAFSAGPFASVLESGKSVLGKIGIVVIVIKAGALVAAGQWKLAFIEVVKGVVSLAVPVIGLVDAIFSVLDAIFPALKSWPIYKFVRSLNPADLIGNAVANVFAVIDLAWTAWGRNDWDVQESLKQIGAILAKEIVVKSLQGLLDRIKLGWEAVVWIVEWFQGIGQKLLGYGVQPGGRLAPGMAVA